MNSLSKRDIILQLAARRGVIRAEDVIPLGVSAAYIHDLAHDGYLNHVGRGMFELPNFPFTEHHDLVEAARYTPQAVICLLSALRFHNIGTQSPHAVWLAITNKGSVPRLPNAPVQAVRMSPASLNTGVETHILEGVPVRIFSVAKTVADCFKFRSSVGLDVAIEALKDGFNRRLISPNDLYEPAVANRAWHVMQPYIEALQ